ncbi:hypothetical protein ACMFY5_02195, partial [Pseudomonas sihuiensis]
MPRLTLEINTELYRMLQQAARTNHMSIEDECLRRRGGGAPRSRDKEAQQPPQRPPEAPPRAARGGG